MYTAVVATKYHDIYCYISSLHITYNTYIYTYVSTYTLAIYIYIYIYTLFSIYYKQHNIFYLTFKVFFDQNDTASICDKIYVR